MIVEQPHTTGHVGIEPKEPLRNAIEGFVQALAEGRVSGIVMAWGETNGGHFVMEGGGLNVSWLLDRLNEKMREIMGNLHEPPPPGTKIN